MTHETILLDGGPWNGQRMSWSGGDFIELAEMPRMPVTPLSGVGPAMIPPLRRHLYRRAVWSPNYFAYQGSRA